MAAPARKSTAAEAEALLDAFAVPGGEAAWVAALRAKAAQGFAAAGAPVRRDEYWRFTDPASLTRLPAPEAAVFEGDARPDFDGIDRLRIVFVDGVLAPELSDNLAMDGVEIVPLGVALRTDIHWARELYGQLEARGQVPVSRPFAALNTARAVEGLAIRVTGIAPRPIDFSYLHRATRSDALVHHVIRLEAGSEITVLENGPGASRFNTVSEVEVGDGARFHHVRLQGRDHERRAATALFARLGARASFHSFTLTVNGRLTRNECVLEFTGDDAEARIAGACAGDDDFHHDDTVFVTHGAVNCRSRQVFKKVLRGDAVGVFQGKILVRPGAQKTDGYQISQALLLDETSQFLAKPELEIYADDVKCSHGSTCGAVDPTALFYLTSRGIPRAEAEGLLVLAFLDEAIAEIEDAGLAEDIRERLAAWIARRD